MPAEIIAVAFEFSSPPRIQRIKPIDLLPGPVWHGASVARPQPVSHPDGRIDHVPDTPRSLRPNRTPAARGTEPEQLGFEGMPEPLFVCTPSKLGAYEDCPRRYRYGYVDRPGPPKGPAWAHNSLGASVHTALRGWYVLEPAKRRPEALASLLRATWVSEGYRDEEQERSAFRTALEWLEHYLDGLDPADEPVGVERVVGVKTATLALSGRVDRIDRRGDELVIVDYKTGRSGLDPDDARGSQALALYALAAQRVFRRRCRKVELHHLPSGTVVGHEHTDESVQRHLARAEATGRDIVTAERAVAAGADPDAAFPARPGALCGWCDYRRTCPAAQAQVREPWAGLLRDRGLRDEVRAGDDPRTT
jgi:RecB family exonuclease